MEINSIIESMGVYLPKRCLSTKEAIAGCIVKPAVDLEELTGIKNRAIVGENEYAIDLAVKAVDKCFSISKYQPNDIDMIVCPNLSRFNGKKWEYWFEPSTPIKLRQHFDFKNAISFNVSNACAGMFTAIQVLDAYIKAGWIRRGLVVCGEWVTHLATNAQKEISSPIDPQFASLTIGDSAVALILEGTKDTDKGFKFIDVITVAEHCKLCIGGPSTKEHGGYSMRTESSLMHKIGVPLSIKQLTWVMKEIGWDGEHQHFLIPHQTASRAIKSFGKEMNKEIGSPKYSTETNMVDNIAQRGNTATTTHFVALWDFINKGIIESGSNLLLAIQASGIILGVAAYTLDDLPKRIINSEKNIQEQNCK